MWTQENFMPLAKFKNFSFYLVYENLAKISEALTLISPD